MAAVNKSVSGQRGNESTCPQVSTDLRSEVSDQTEDMENREHSLIEASASPHGGKGWPRQTLLPQGDNTAGWGGGDTQVEEDGKDR